MKKKGGYFSWCVQKFLWCVHNGLYKCHGKPRNFSNFLEKDRIAGGGGVLREVKDRFIESRIYVAQLPTKSVIHFGSRSDQSIPAQAITPGPGGEERLHLVRVRGPGAECIDLV